MKSFTSLAFLALSASTAVAQYKVNGTEVTCEQNGSWCYNVDVIIRCSPGYYEFGTCEDELSADPASPSAQCETTGPSEARCYIPSNPNQVENTYTNLGATTTLATSTSSSVPAATTSATVQKRFVA